MLTASIVVCATKHNPTMFTHKDIEYRTIFVVNCLEKRNLRVSNGELLLEEVNDIGSKTLTKLPFQKILALFVIGHISVTTPLIEKCKKFNIALVVMKPSLRPVFFWADAAEANYLLRRKQYEMSKNDISIAKIFVANKIANQLTLLKNTRMSDELTTIAKFRCTRALDAIDAILDYDRLMGLEGIVSKSFFAAYFQNNKWTVRRPRIKSDALNATLDIGYTILFNYIESFVRMFGFDIYAGVYHRLWFKRKSLVCDLMEPFRCIIDNTVRSAFNRKQCTDKDFVVNKGEWRLRTEKNKDYCRLFFDVLIRYKGDVFKYIQAYYRCFMRGATVADYPKFLI